MADLDYFEKNARRYGLLIDTNLMVLLVAGAVNRDRIARFKRTSAFSPVDWDLLIGVLEQISPRHTLPHVLAEVGTLIDLRGPERDLARTILQKLISELQELGIASADACTNSFYAPFGLTDAAIAEAARIHRCSVLTNDSGLYVALAERNSPVAHFDHLRALL